MRNPLNETIGNQFEAALSTLNACIKQCPDAVWSHPIGIYTFNRLAFHTLFFTDLYLGPDQESLKNQAFHREHPEFFGDYEELEYRDPVAHYEKGPLQRYVKHCRNRLHEVLAAESADVLNGPSGFEGRDFTRGELHIYSLRHIQHHAGQLAMCLRAEADIGIPWFGSGWRDE